MFILWSIDSPGAMAQDSQRHVWNVAGFKAAEQRQFDEAERLFRNAIREAESAGSEDNTLATSLHDLARVYWITHKYAEAEPLYKRSLAIYERTDGPDSRGVVVLCNGLASLYRTQEKFSDAEPLLKRGLAIKEKNLGTKPVELAGPVRDLAALYHDQAMYAEAEPFYKRSLDIVEKAYGPEHEAVASHLSQLAHLFIAQGKFAEAQSLFERSLSIHELIFRRIMEPEDDRVADALLDLAYAYEVQGKYTPAQPLYERALAIYETVKGREDPIVAETLACLALIYACLGRTVDSDVAFEWSQAIKRRNRGTADLDAAARQIERGKDFMKQGKHREAEGRYSFVKSVYEKNFGPDHHNVAEIYDILATIRRFQKRDAEAHYYAKRAEQIRRKPKDTSESDQPR